MSRKHRRNPADPARKNTAETAGIWKKGDRLELYVEDLADTGEGIGRAAGFAFFVKDAVPGDTVEATVMKCLSRYGYAHLDRIVKPSPDRIEAPCANAKSCGGCQLQALSFSAEMSCKERRVRNALIRIGGIPEETVEKVMLPISGAESPGKDEMPELPEGIYRYRNKAQLPIGADRDGRPCAGFYAARSHRVIPVDDCLLGDPIFAEITHLVLDHMERLRITPYDERTGEGLVRHLLIRRGYHSGQISVTLVVNRDRKQESGDPEKYFPQAAQLADRLYHMIPGMTSFTLNLNAERTNVILGPELLPVRGDPWIEDTMCGLTFRISPLSFYQVNTAQAERLYRQAMEFAGLVGEEAITPGTTVIDLYCGIGTISLLAAKHAARVIGVEVVPEAVRNAATNAEINGIKNAEFRCGRAEEVLPALLEKGVRADVLIVDPPRAGLDPACISAIRQLSPARIVYVSCNPATLARDLKLLLSPPETAGNNAGLDASSPYSLRAVRPYNFFPRTVHCETVVCLSQQKPDDHIEIEIDLDEIDATSAETKATYKEIQNWVQEHHGFHVTNLNIAQVKQKHGIIERENYNKPKSEDSKQPRCPEEKVKAIEDAMRHFQMIP